MTDAMVQRGSRSVWVRRGLALVVLGLAFTGGYWVANAPQTRRQDATLVVAETALNFGEVWEDADFAWELPVENRTATDLRVVEFQSSCGCGTIKPRALEVSAGQTRRIRLKLDLTYNPRRAADGPSPEQQATGATRDFSVKIGARVQGADGSTQPPAVWTVWGRVRPALTVEPGAVGFGDDLVQGQPCPSRVVSVIAHTALRRIGVTCEPDVAAARLTRLAGDGSKYELTIRPRSDLPAGPLKFNVVLRPQSPDGALPRVTIPVEGRVLQDVQATPALVQFGVCRLGQRARNSVVLRSSSGTPFEVERVECEAPDTTIEEVKAGAAEKEYRITQRIAKRENQSGTVHFHVRLKGKAGIVVPVQVKYLGVAG